MSIVPESQAPGTRSAGQTFLIGPTLYLRPVEPADAGTAPRWSEFAFPRPVEVVRDQIEERLKKGPNAEEQNQLLIACRRIDDKPVGSVEMRMNNWRYVFMDFVVDPLLFDDAYDDVLAEIIEIVVTWTIRERNVMVIEFALRSGLPKTENILETIGGRSCVHLREFRLHGGARVPEIWYQVVNPVWVNILGERPCFEEGPVARQVRSPATISTLLEERHRPQRAYAVSDRLVLRPFEPDEGPILSHWAMRETEIVFPEGRFPENGYAIGRHYLERAKADPPRSVGFAIALRSSDELIGINALIQVNWIHRTAETATVILRPEHRGSGLGTEAKHLLLEHAFERLGFHAVFSYVHETNQRSAAALRKQGYRDAGYVAWDAMSPNGVCGGWVFDLLADEWRQARDQTKD
ncbi:hypothetical protein BH23CHL5_BH23CHL5_26360 [soil metagenome]